MHLECNTIHQADLKSIDEIMEALTNIKNIREALNIDSFDSLQFIVALNEKLGIEIPEQDYGKTPTFHKLVDYVETKMK